MKPRSILFVGCGDLAGRAGHILREFGCEIFGACRNTRHVPEFIEAIAADYTRAGSLDFIEAMAPEVVVMTAKPTSFSAAGYEQGFPMAVANLLAGLGSHRPRLILFVSSTRAFAESSGGWVDENSDTAKHGFAALAILAAERALSRSAQAHCILRFGGIYGDPQGRLLSRVATGEICAPDPVRFGNRIHREDCAGFIAHLCLMDDAQRESLYIGVDDDPAPQHEVELWLAQYMGVAARNMPTVGQQRSSHKRCRNLRMKQGGYRLRYPDFRQGYAATLAQDV